MKLPSIHSITRKIYFTVQSSSSVHSPHIPSLNPHAERVSTIDMKGRAVASKAGIQGHWKKYA